MQRTLISDLRSHFGEQVKLSGFLHDFRNLGKIAFLIIRDRTGMCQIILDTPEQIDKFNGLYVGTVCDVIGTPVSAPGNKKFGMEVQHVQVTITQPVNHVHGIDISKEDLILDMESMIDNRVVTLRHPKQQAIFKIAAIVEKNMRAYFDANGFTQFTSPKLIGFPTEGGAEIFSLDYFEKKAYLAQSPQFYKQMMVPVFERVYEIGKAYRAEKSNSSRHVSEILMLDVEMGFIDFEYLLGFITNFVNTVIDTTRNEGGDKLNMLAATKPVLTENFPRITVAELHELMYKETGEDHRGELDVATAEEKFICEYSATHRACEAVIVTGFPRSDAKFYHIQDKNNPEVAERADLLFRGVEIATITMRQTDYDRLIQQILERGFDPTNPGLTDYLDAFKYGMPQEGGFGLGIARLVQKIIGLSNVKEADLFPRDRNRLTP